MAFDDMAKRMAHSHGKRLGEQPSMIEFEQTGWDNKRRSAIAKLAYGALLFGGGLAITIVSTIVAAEQSGYVYVKIGMILGGIVEIGRGFAGLRQLGPRPQLAAARLVPQGSRD
jgi:hypothetical protein